MTFEWDKEKDIINQKKHGLSFKDAKYVFADPFALVREDYTDSEPRQQIMGHIGGILLVLVVYTMRDQQDEDVFRIISARRKQQRQRGGSMKQENGFSPMDEDTKARLAKLAELPDSEIDTSDIKEWSDEDFSRAVPFHDIYKPRKEQITTRIDADNSSLAKKSW